MFSLNNGNPLVILEMAQNHQGSVAHGLEIIHKFHEVTKNYPFQFGFKLQYRDLDTFIHSDFKDNTSFKYIKRFSETRLSNSELKILKDEMQTLGFVTICTPFDESSVDLIEKHGFDAIKVASCSFTDWSLWERIAKTDKPIIASTAGANLEDIEKVVSFLEHRNKEFALLHCVAEYPTPSEHLKLDRITLLKEKFPQIRIGYSTHESPDNLESVKVAIAKGATIFEKHVGYGQKLNVYSLRPYGLIQWLETAKQTYAMCKIELNETEISELKSLQRGAYAKKFIAKGATIDVPDLFFALPVFAKQFTANDFSKYAKFVAIKDVYPNSILDIFNTERIDTREQVYGVVKKVNEFVLKSGLTIPHKVDIELSHHYGLDKFFEYGMTIFTIVNQEYCKKLLILLPRQKHPKQYHLKKTETYHILEGDSQDTL